MQEENSGKRQPNSSQAQGQDSSRPNPPALESTASVPHVVAAADRRTLLATRSADSSVKGLRVEVVAGPHRGIRMDFYHPATLTVGRGDDVALQLVDDPYFSRHHFQLEIDPPRCRLRDLRSSNGTQVNGRRVMDCFLHAGDEISGGQTTILFSEIARPETTAALGQTDTSETYALGAFTTLAMKQKTDQDRLPLLRPPGYEILRKIGEGGMGSVYLARRNSDKQEFALKLVMPESAIGPSALTLFLREISVLSQLDHPRIVKLHEIGETQGQFYFVMEYVPAIDLRALLDSSTSSQRDALACRVIADALEGLGYAHDRGFVHRDFKPSNLLVNWEGGLPSVKVADFGLAKNFMNAGFSGITTEARVMGTLTYMSMEQAADARFVLPAADIYSAGATLYYLLAGQPPYQFGSSRSALAQMAANDPVPLAQHRPDLDPGLTAIVHQALARRPDDRFASAAQMRLALLPFAAELTPRSLPPGMRQGVLDPI
jgi:pSer/pThr/pTyr-binding forkhead associated (FHA) protein